VALDNQGKGPDLQGRECPLPLQGVSISGQHILATPGHGPMNCFTALSQKTYKIGYGD